ncbi:hypothetical protein McanCB49686_007930 [Microsporum canis]
MHFKSLVPLTLISTAVAQTIEGYIPHCGVSVNILGPDATCEGFAKENHISVEKFKQLNPGVSCPNLQRGKSYCFEGEFESAPNTTLLSTAAPGATTTTSPAVTTEETTVAPTTVSTVTSSTATTKASTTKTKTTAPTSSTQTAAPNSAHETRALAQAATTYSWITMSVLMGYYLCINI